jgi:hypothetical protein
MLESKTYYQHILISPSPTSHFSNRLNSQQHSTHRPLPRRKKLYSDMANQEGREDKVIPATFGEWYLARVPIDAVAIHLPRVEAVTIYVDSYLSYLGRPEFPQSYHNLWQTHIQAVRTLQQTSFDFFPSSPVFGRLSLQEYIRTTRDTHLLTYPTLDEYQRYCKTLQNYSKYVSSWESSPDYETLMELQRQQVLRTRRRLLSQTWEDIREYGVCTPPLLDPYI